ncbi:hypothetical protein HWV03_08560 [Moritella sp. 36]|uniref:hypothetical protein n=1 Tax=Moritella sp. 36 TaxID=2746233 RepID=UPI001BACBD45|nr:hypothetical protein [Moritella sp. 36]QUM88846.1 hypothetical protein HWV03_08560 [Moritella sp. 36]
MKNFNRDDAFSMSINDPENIDEFSKIIDSIVIGDELYIFKTKSVFRMLTAESIDPDWSALDTKHSYEKISDFGTESEYISRCILQAEKLLPVITKTEKFKSNVLEDLWELNLKLLNCRNVVCDLDSHYSTLIPKCNQIILDNESSNVLPPLPKIPELEEKVRVFLTNSKLVLIALFKFLAKFYPLPIGDRGESHFNKHVKWFETNIGSEHNISKLLKADLEWIRLLSECRNAIEHSGKGQKIDVVNFTLKPGNKFSPPNWTYDLTKKLGFKKGPHDLLNDLDVLCSNMLHLVEDLILLVTQDKLVNHPLIAVYKVDEAKINKECLINYDITIKSNLSVGL